MLIFSPYFNEKSLEGPDLKFEESTIPLATLLYFLKSSNADIKSKESFLSGKPIPTNAFYPLSLTSIRAKNLEESKHLCTNGS